MPGPGPLLLDLVALLAVLAWVALGGWEGARDEAEERRRDRLLVAFFGGLAVLAAWGLWR